MANHYHKPAPATRAPTIHAALCVKLGREPTNAELKAEVERIIAEGNALGRAR